MTAPKPAHHPTDTVLITGIPVAGGALEDPNRPKTVQESSELEDAKAQAEAVLADAQAAADEIRAKAEQDAKAQAEAAQRAADKVLTSRFHA